MKLSLSILTNIIVISPRKVFMRGEEDFWDELARGAGGGECQQVSTVITTCVVKNTKEYFLAGESLSTN